MMTANITPGNAAVRLWKSGSVSLPTPSRKKKESIPVVEKRKEMHRIAFVANAIENKI